MSIDRTPEEPIELVGHLFDSLKRAGAYEPALRPSAEMRGYTVQPILPEHFPPRPRSTANPAARPKDSARIARLS